MYTGCPCTVNVLETATQELQLQGVVLSFIHLGTVQQDILPRWCLFQPILCFILSQVFALKARFYKSLLILHTFSFTTNVFHHWPCCQLFVVNQTCPFGVAKGNQCSEVVTCRNVYVNVHFKSVYLSKRGICVITECIYSYSSPWFHRALLVLLVLQASQVLLVLRYECLLLLVQWI